MTTKKKKTTAKVITEAERFAERARRIAGAKRMAQFYSGNYHAAQAYQAQQRGDTSAASRHQEAAEAGWAGTLQLEAPAGPPVPIGRTPPDLLPSTE